MKVAVVGLGYVGLVQAAGFAKLGHVVLGIDIDAKKIQNLQQGVLNFFEPELEDLLASLPGNFSCTVDMGALHDFAPDVVLICVPTPAREDGACETSFVEQSVAQVAGLVRKKTLVVIKSTVPPGIHESLVQCEGENIELASAPEFLREGKAIYDFFNPDRIVLGVQSKWAESILRALHEGIKAPVFTMSVESAQLTKYAANAMLATRLSFVNELANIADLVGADIQSVTQAVGADTRIGPHFLRAGAGFGGSCFPKDVLALAHTAQERGYHTRLIRPIIEINKDQPVRFVEKIKAHLGHFQGKRFAVWGLAFAANTDDVRESPALRVIQLLLQEGAEITAHDPRANARAASLLGNTIAYAPTAQAALHGNPDALLVLTEWPEFAQVNWHEVKQALIQPIVFDGKNFLPRAAIQEAGLEYCGIGVCN